MQKLSDKLNLPRNVLETSSIIYRKALKANFIRGRSILEVVTVTLYIACRICGVVRTLNDFAEAADISRKAVARNYRFLYNGLDLDIPRFQQTSHIRKLVSRLGLHGYTEMLAKQLVDEASSNNLTNGRSTAGIAAACIYISSRIMGEGLTQQKVAVEAQVTEVTIRNRYKELLRNLDIVIPV
jgi:transcription initiation factor TFIIB